MPQIPLVGAHRPTSAVHALRFAGAALVPLAACAAAYYLVPQDPRFTELPIEPFAWWPVLLASFYGKRYSMAALAAWVFGILVLQPFLSALDGAAVSLETIQGIAGLESPAFALSLIASWLLGMTRDRHVGKAKRLEQVIARLREERRRARQEIEAFKAVSDELERRVARQSDSVTLLTDKIDELYSLDLELCLTTILEIVESFTGAARCSLWKLEPESRTLSLKAASGRLAVRPDSLPVEGSIEGWVARNKQFFSVKMLIEYDSLRRMDQGGLIYCAPILEGGRVWGVVDIEELPFERFNLYTEKMLDLILLLAAPALERAVEYRQSVESEAIDPVTGFPSYADFVGAIERDLIRQRAKGASLSVFLFELCNYDALAREHGEGEAKGLMRVFADAVSRIGRNPVSFYQFRAPGQFGCVARDLDTDGAALLAFEALGKASELSFAIRGAAVQPEFALGFSTATEAGESGVALLLKAEIVLEKQMA
jgi:GGDEF domain-containing protein